MTTAQTAPPPPMRLRELVFGAACAAALRAAARLGVADALGDTPMAVEDLAAAVKTEPKPLRRLLRALTCYGVFTEQRNGTFAHTDMSRLLREDDPHSLRNITLWCTEPWTWDAWPCSTRRCAPAPTSSRACTARSSSPTSTRTRPSRPKCSTVP